MDYKIYSFYNHDLNLEIPFLQKKIFDKFNIPLTQIVWQKDFDRLKNTSPLGDGTIWYNDHPEFLKHIILNETAEYLIFFDIDCIPLSIFFLERLLNEISDKNTLSGAIQSNNRFGTYMSAWFTGFYRKLYFDCNKPSITDENTDPFLNFTYACHNYNKRVKYWMPTSVDNPPFGTTYENLIYHEMAVGRKIKSQENFIKKCKLVLNYK